MSQPHGTPIEWTHAPGMKGETWNPITGCLPASHGCDNCYAAKLAGTRFKNHPSRAGLVRQNAAGVFKFNGEVRFNEDWLTQPLHWRAPRLIFPVAHGDLFFEKVPFAWVDCVYAVMAMTPQHFYLPLTKRPERMAEYVRQLLAGDRNVGGAAWAIAVQRGLNEKKADRIRHDVVALVTQGPLPNVAAGCSVDDQETAEERIPHLLRTKAVMRFVSHEPALAKVDFRQWLFDYGCGCGWGGDSPLDYCTSCGWRGHASGEIGEARCEACKELLSDYNACPECDGHDGDGLSFGPTNTWLDWLIDGGESGPRPAHPDIYRINQRQCEQSGTAYFHKQNGSWVSVSEVAGPGEHYSFPDGATVRRTGKKLAGATLDGREYREFPRQILAHSRNYAGGGE